MRKLLAMLGSIALTASSASTVLACSDNTQLAKSTDIAETKSLRSESVDSIKSLVLSDQYGLDPVKTNWRVGVDTDTETPDFNTPSSSATKHLNLKGLLGKDNAPLYQWNDELNGLLGKIGVGPVDLSPYFDQWGGIIKEIPYFLSSGNITGLMSLVPTIIENVAGLLKVNIDPGSIGWLGNWLKMNIKYVMDEVNFNNKIQDLINKAPDPKKVNMTYISQKGIDSLNDLANIFLGAYELTPGYSANNSNPKQGDNVLSAFLGTKIFTPLLNKQSIDPNLPKQIFNMGTILGNIKEIIDDASTFIATILYQLSVYVPMIQTKDKQGNPIVPSDTDHLFSNDKTNEAVFKETDAKLLTVANNNIKLGDDEMNLSLNDSLYGVLDMITSTDERQMDIARLTTILFHDEYDVDGTAVDSPLVNQLTYWLIDALKFTDYTVNFDKQKVPVIGEIKFSFKLSDLFKPGKIKLADIPGLIAQAVQVGSSSMSVSIATNGIGLLGDTDNISKLLGKVIRGEEITGDSVSALVKSIIGTTANDSFTIIYEYDWLFKHYKYAVSTSGILWGLIWDGKAAGIVSLWCGVNKLLTTVANKLLETMYYTDGTKFFNDLKGTGLVDDEQLSGIKTALKPYLPLVNKVVDAVSNTPIGDLRKYSGLLNLDSFMNALNILLMQNTIQDNPDGTDSLVEQVLKTIGDASIKPADKATKLNKYLGYVAAPDKSWDKNSTYVYEKGIIGNLVEMMYPDLATKVVTDKDNNPVSVDGVMGALEGKKSDPYGYAISLRKVNLVKSAVVDNLKEVMNQLAGDLQGDDISDIVDPLINDDKVWKTSNVFNKFFNGTKDLQSESFDLTFDTSSILINHRDKNGVVTRLQSKKATYRITFSRIDNQSTFDINNIEKISK